MSKVKLHKKSAPVESAPVESAPVESAPVESAPVESAPVESDIKSENSRRNTVSLFIATPCYNCTLTEGYFHSMLRLQLELQKHGIFYKIRTVGNESLITRARNSLVAEFLGDDRFTHLLFIDADLKFDTSLVFRMLSIDEDVVAGCYTKKGINWKKIPEFCIKYERFPTIHEMPFLTAMWNINLQVNKSEEGNSIETMNGFMSVKDAPTGFMMLKREALEEMSKHYPEKYVCDSHVYINEKSKDNFFTFFDTMIDPDSKRYLSEDYAFCRKWQKIGGKVWMDYTTPFIHYGTYGFCGDPGFFMKDIIQTDEGEDGNVQKEE